MTRLDRALVAASAVAWLGLVTWVALDPAIWPTLVFGVGLVPGGLFGCLGQAIADADATSPALAAVLLFTVIHAPCVAPCSPHARRAWSGLSIAQAITVAIALRLLDHPDMASECGNARYGRFLGPLTIVGVPLALLQAAAWCSLAGAAWRAPREALGPELRNAVVLAALPAVAWLVAVHPGLARASLGAPEHVLVPAHVAITLTACAAMVGVALALRLRSPPAPDAT